MGTAQDASSPSKSYEQIQAEITSQLKASTRDTSRVRLLLELSDFHWHKTGKHDSSIVYAERAHLLSRELQFADGIDVSCFYLCRAFVRRDRIAEARALVHEVSKEEQVHLQIRIGEEFLFRPTLKKDDLDSAYAYFTKALQQSKEIASRKWRHESLIALGKYHFAKNEFSKAKSCFMEIIHDFQQSGERSSEAHIWSELGKYMPDNDSTFEEQLHAHGNAMRLYQELQDTNNERSVLEDIAWIQMLHQNFDLAKEQFLHAIELRNSVGNKTMYRDYVCIAWSAHAMGDLDEALSYALATMKNLESLGVPVAPEVDMLLGQIYADEGQPEKSLQHLLKVAPVIHDRWSHFICKKVVDQYILLGQPTKALSFLLQFEKSRQAKTPADKETIAGAKGDCYMALDNPTLAERYYLQMIELDHEAQKYGTRDIFPIPFTIAGPEAYYKISDFYSRRHRHETARFYLDKALKVSSFSAKSHYTSNLMGKIWLLKFKTDSASGDYAAAIRDYQKYTALNDSIFNTTKIRQFQKLQVQFETEKKENELIARDEQIKTLVQNDQLRQANLEQANLIRNITIAIVGVLMITATLLYRQYRQKRATSKVIAHKNTQLEHLLTEKEWLLKEVHHRVKNNLHTIICLLESQAIYLQDDALKAIENSQHRVYAMSLIHQKLYQTDTLKTIEMSEYLPEFIRYLKDGFGISYNIAFQLDIHPLQLDVSKAVPIALILNEAVTNAIKYAFPEERKGVIRVEMQTAGEEVSLVIADNGIGIKHDINEGKPNSLGLELIKGLSQDINGHLEIEKDHGTRISISFKAEPIYEERNIANVSAKEEAFI